MSARRPGARDRGGEDGGALEIDVALPGRIRVRARAWIEADGEAWLGFGRVELLRRIDGTGSISAAARAMGMSYRHAWKLVDAMNRAGPAPLVAAAAGGARGGGATLTDAGKRAIALYERLDRRLQGFKKSLAAELAKDPGGTTSA